MAGRLYAWVLLAIIVGALTGHFQPEFAVKLKPLGDGFIKLIKMLVTPIVFCTVVLGIAAMPDLRKVGRVGIKALVYFEVLTTVALVIGLVVVNTLQPGAGFHVDPTTLDARAVASYAGQAHSQSIVDFLLGIIPTTFTSAFVSGELLQVLLVAVLFGVALAMIGERGRAMVEVLESLSAALFRIVAMVMWLAPLGAMGAMAFTIGKYGLSSLGPLASLMGSFYLTCLLFVVVVLGAVCRLAGFSLFRLLGYIKEEMLTVVGTSSSESVLAPLMEKLERLGCRRTTVGLVVPTGYSFNLDGTSIYLTMAAVFLAQALDIDLTLGQELTIILVAMLTSKGAAAVTGGGFITLAATLAVIPAMPVAALALILGVDRFMSEARALTNLVGNAVATVVVSRWEREVSGDQVQAALAAG